MFAIFLIIRWQHLLYCTNVQSCLKINWWKYVSSITWILLFIVGHLLPPLLDGKIYCFPRNIRTAAYTTPIASLSHWRPHKHNPRIKHIRAQVNWQNTTNSNIQICRAKITRSSKCRDQNIGDNLFYCWPPAKLNRPYLRRNSRDKQTFLRLKVPPQENAPSCIRYCTSREIQNPNIQCYCFSILKKYSIENYTFLACPDNISIMIINRRMIRSWFFSDKRKSRRWLGSVVHVISYISIYLWYICVFGVYFCHLYI